MAYPRVEIAIATSLIAFAVFLGVYGWNGGSVGRKTAMGQIRTLDDLRAADSTLFTDGEFIVVHGYHDATDAAGGTFVFQRGAVVADDGGVSIIPKRGGGVWIRQWSGPLNVKWFGARGDGASDDAPAVNRAVDLLAKLGGGALLFPAGTFALKNAIKLRSNISYVGVGWASVLKAHEESTDNILGESSESKAVHVVIRDLQIDGNNAGVSAFPSDDALGNAVRFNNVSQSRIEHVWIHDTVMNAISLYNLSHDNVVAECRIERTGSQRSYPGAASWSGIYVEFGCSRIQIRNNRILDVRGSAIWSQAGDADNYDLVIAHNFLSGGHWDGIRLGDDSGNHSHHRALITGNTVINFPARGAVGIRVFHATGSGLVEDIRIVDNYVELCAASGICVQGKAVYRTVVSGNTSRRNGAYGIQAAGEGTLVTGNIFGENAAGEIYSAAHGP